LSNGLGKERGHPHPFASLGAGSGFPLPKGKEESQGVGMRLDSVTFAYDGRTVLSGISLDIAPGEMVALLGPNGSGKTTLLKTMLGLLRPQRGEVTLDGQPLAGLSRRGIAQRVAAVPQQFHMPFAFTVEEVVMLGRTPHLRPLVDGGPADKAVVRAAMDLCGLTALAGRPFNELSGGERQRVVMAMGLAQEPRVLLLDEPVAHLDIHQQVETLEVVRCLNADQGVTVVAAMHDLNLASLYFARLVLLSNGEVFAEGHPCDVITCENLERVFGARVEVTRHPTVAVPYVVVLPQAVATPDVARSLDRPTGTG